ncbi:MAG: heparinase II/III family protein [Chitinophagaceae bacterium]|nr:heparinase II/III family protein [Chitinophagaceae bacterium]
MTAITKSSALFVALFIITSSVSSQVDSIKDQQLPGHPRILLLKDEEKVIVKNTLPGTALSSVHSSILQASDALLTTAPLERIKIGRRLLDKSREGLRRIFYLSYAYRTTQKEVYLNRAEKELVALAAFSDWNPTHFLDVAEMTMAVAIGYDWLHSKLSDSSKTIIRTAILEKGINVSLDPKYNGWLASTHNWNQVCNAGISFGALAIYEDHPEIARTVLNRAIRSVRLPMEEYGPDGAYMEGYGYWGYGTGFNVMFLSAIEKLYGQDFGLTSIPGFLKTGDYFENMTGPSGLPFNYSDASSQSQFNPSIFWFAQKTNDPSLLWQQLNSLRYTDSKTPMRDRLLPACMIWGGGIATQQVTPPDSKIYVGAGKNPVALMRTSWTDKNAIYVGIKGGSPSLNHAHMDVGSFVMEAKGVRWAMDFGMQDYESLESKKVDLWGKTQNAQRWQIFRYNNMAHNTLTVNGELQKVEGEGIITSSSGNALFLNAITDITPLYKGLLGRAHRGIAIIDSSYVVVRDEIETLSSEATVRWTMVTPADVKIISTSEALLTKDGKELIMRIDVPGAKISTWPTVPVNSYDAPNPGTIFVGFEIRVPANSKMPLNVLLIPRNMKKLLIKKIVPLDKWPRQLTGTGLAR